MSTSTDYPQQAKYRRTYERHSVLALDAVLPYVGEKKKDVIWIDQETKVGVGSMRLRVFANKGVTCVSCGIKGHYFAIERHLSNHESTRWHLNLYCSNGRMMTVDHTIPKSKGGRRNLSNLKPMCSNCNHDKGCRMPVGQSDTDASLPKTEALLVQPL